MVGKNDNSDFQPTIAIPPGETIKENMKFLGMNQKELAARLGLTPKHFSNIINGNSPITYDTALMLETVIGPSAQFWMNLETNYQLNKARIEKHNKLDLDLEILKRIPYKEMSDLGWVEKTPNRVKRVMNSRVFFGVGELSAIKDSYNVAYRKHKHAKEISDLGVLAWLRRLELEGLNARVGKLNRRKLKKLIPVFRKLTTEKANKFYPELVKLCAECGVALVLIPYLPRTYICGATIWRKNKAIIGLSVKGKRADIFWFTFFHEIAHLINHSSMEFSIKFDTESEEAEADILASSYLITREQFREFVDRYDYIDRGAIITYAREIGIAPFILLGRLQHEGILGHHYCRDLIPSYEIPSNH